MITVQLEPSDREIIRRCLAVAVDGPFFEDWEFQTLFGVNRDQVRTVLQRWPAVDLSEENVFLAVNNTLANLLGYPHGKNLGALVGATAEDLERLVRWVQSHELM
jgi:hypothetical protein